MTSFDEFRRLCGKGNVIPLVETLLADTETPVSVYLKIRKYSPYSFLLESVEGGEKLARYSFLGFNPFMIFRITGSEYSIEVMHDDVSVLPSLTKGIDHPLEALKKIFEHIRTVSSPELPRFTGGAVGYFGYETAQLVENIPVTGSDDLKIPDATLLFCDVVVVFDNVLHRLSLVSNAYIPHDNMAEGDLRKEYEKAAREIEQLKVLLRTESAAGIGAARSNGTLRYLMSKDSFCRAVESCKQYIVEGDVFQVVLSQRLQQQATLNDFDLYRALRGINPSPYMYFLNLSEFSIIGSSPEMLVRVDGNVVETRPIAGTRRRGKNPDEDDRLARELLGDPKERAEHLMLVDLGRNDLGRISEYGSVQVNQFMTIERYSHVMHLVSSVQGILRDGRSPVDALFACFPAGTLSGAPKVRAMQIIAELEQVKRGVYGGAIAYIDFSGNLDSCIAIRTIVSKDNILYFQAGAGIVYDSIPEREYEETLEKLAANLKALDMLFGEMF